MSYMYIYMQVLQYNIFYKEYMYKLVPIIHYVFIQLSPSDNHSNNVKEICCIIIYISK